jgi:hypothetical protein
MPTFRHGKNTGFKLNDSGGVVRTLSDLIEDVSFPRSVDASETTTFGTSAKTYIAGLQDTKITIKGKYDATATTGIDTIIPAIIAAQDTGTITVGSATPPNTANTVGFSYAPEGFTSTRVLYTGQALVTSYEVSSPVADVVSFSLELQVSGAVTKGTVS